MKCPSLLSSLLASAIFLVAGAAPAFPQTSEQALMNLEMVPDSVRISFTKECPVPGWTPYRIRFYSMEDWSKYEGEYMLFEQDCGSIVIRGDEEIYALLGKLKGRDTLRSREQLEYLEIGSVVDNLPDSSFCRLYDGQYKDKLKWNISQQNLLAQAMRDPQVRRNHVERQLSRYRCVVELYLSGRELGKMELGGKESFVRGIWHLVPSVQHLDWMDLMKLIVNDYVDSHPQDFHNLGWQDYPEHFDALSENFLVEERSLLLDNCNIAGGGRYTANRHREYAAVLKLMEPFRRVDKVAYPNVRIVYCAAESDGVLPRIGNLHKKVRKVVEKVLDVPYFSERVEQKGQRMNVWFFNDRNVNDYLISLVAGRAAKSGIGEEELQRSILVEFPSRNKPDMYLLLPDNRIMLLIDKGFRYNYGALHKQMSAAVPDSIEIHWKTEGFVDIPNIQKGRFRSGWVDLFPYAHSEKPYVVFCPDKVSQVYAAISCKDITRIDLEEFGINPEKVRRDTDKIWKIASNYNKRDKYYKRFSMNRMQRRFFRESFSDRSNLERYMLQVLKGGPWYEYNAVNEFTAILHWGGGGKDTLLSGRDFFAHSLYPFVKDEWKGAAETHTPQGDALYFRLLDLWMLEHNEEMHKLGVYDIRGQIKELEKDFEVVEAGQLMDFGSGGGVFVKNDVPAYYALLRTEDMPEYMDFKYIFEKRSGKFPEFDNLRRDFPDMVEKLKGIPFFQKLLGEGYLKIIVSYVNDSMMSEYQIKRNVDYNNGKIFEDNPDFRCSLERGGCIYVEAVKPWLPYNSLGSGDERVARYLANSFVISPDGKILVSAFGNRFFFPIEYNLTDPSSWVVNSQGQTWMAPIYGGNRNSILLDMEGSFLPSL